MKTMHLTNLAVEDKTEEVYLGYYKNSLRTHGTLFQQLVVHAANTGFDPLTAPLIWAHGKRAKKIVQRPRV